ncbi:hypothetical protein [Pelagibacterium luteolum]|uniref:Uncharacterized protein n=1 Tax=Pelagibacterium luteolum TaxID=440168 RepID=A0A1G7TJQ7_9HYPH|nr:hypothetical protein [Pelagibacterium luteolum]SDG35548.1 hypothetical protein SAMN04487974_102173 [Pelagibacterium luteolum]
MNIPRYIRKAIWAWQDWQFDRRMKRERPEWFAAREKARMERKRHGKVKPLDIRTQAACREELQRELGHG